eukprot:TRINITY_DN2666_c0_g1_i3.p1 TRINITY_DN2666_c0_g1~~TRINITY_DN2666_c0_g1_i3.p1  ORF type:complete len:412 (+),score=78.51 TRINITY_DN2666_c0_g1_i3:106-1236(+)
MAYNQGVTNGFGCRYILHHKLSLEAAPEFSEGSLDGAFIDGLHTYEGVRDDISAWSVKVKAGGVLMFNDYGNGPFPGVKKAVQEFASSTPGGVSGIEVIGIARHGNVYVTVGTGSAGAPPQTSSASGYHQAPSEPTPVVAAVASSEAVVQGDSCGHPTSCDGPCADLLKVILDNRKRSTWNVYYDEIADFLIERKANRIVEIGTAWGGLANRLLTKLPGLELHCVDPFLAGYDKHDLQSQIYEGIQKKFNLDGPSFSKVYAQAMAYNQGTVNGFGCRYILHHKLSLDGAAEFAEGSIDGAFIDGLHTYEGVRDDINAWKSKTRAGGVLMFNDYGNGPFPGVKKAVQEFAATTPQGVAGIETIGVARHGNVYITVGR